MRRAQIRLTTVRLLCALALLGVLGGTLAFVAPARAQDATSGASYVTPFPENDVYRLQVIGDSLAEDLLAGVRDSFAGDTRVQVQRGRTAISGLLRTDFDDDLRSLDANLARTQIHVALVMIGLNDRYSWRPPQGTRRASVGSDEWKAEYGRRVDRLMKTLKAKGAALYWIGLPIMRRSDASDDAQMMNELVRERAYVNGQKFIDIFSQFADESGAYSSYGPDIDGKARLLRESDGVHFTQAGQRKLAHFVEREIRRDLNQARSERTIPLAGADAEQKHIRQTHTPTAGQSAGGKPPSPSGKDTKGQGTGEKVAAGLRSGRSPDGQGDVKADNTRITLKSTGANGKEESVVVDLLRPAIPASVVAVITRRESPNRASQIGDSITSDIGGGLTVVSSVTLSSDAFSADRRRLPPTQTPYYRVLVKGEHLPPKPGRADDFSWPKPEPPTIDANADAAPVGGVKLAPAKARRPAQPNG